jgi:signal transduction histidine kinase
MAEGSPSIADQLARLAQLEADFQRTLEVEKLESLAEFAAGAGHEINNPLTVISGRAQLLLREETDPERQHALALISAQAMRVYEMIADMMLFARPPRPEPQSVELIALIDNIVADFLPRGARQETAIRRVAAEKGSGPIGAQHPPGRSGQLDLTPFPPPMLIEADPVQLNVALRAICQNSLEALQSGGHIEIECSRHTPCADESETSSFVQIRISDDGPGIAPEERRHLFDPFYSARQAGRGLGLGLSKAWRIITNHGGRLDVQSQPGHGATFVVTLPTKDDGAIRVSE